MRVAHLGLTDFRNYETAEVGFEAGPNLIVGINGQGKTNLVEALAYLSTLGSHRVSSDQALIRFGRDSAIVRVRLEHGDRQVLLEVQINRAGANRAQVNRGPIKPRELPRHVATVVFAPEDLALVRGEPAGRRRFLDELLVQKSPRFAGVLSDYDRVLRQRNTLLKSARASRTPANQLTTLDVWDERLVQLGVDIVRGRLELINQLRNPVRDAYERIAGSEHHAELSPRLSILEDSPEDGGPGPPTDAGALTAADAAEHFRARLVTHRRAELDRGLTLVGPHRDDLVLDLNGLPARGYASHGESWSFALSLKLASAEVLRTDAPLGDPVLVLDDVFAELDERRRTSLSAAIAGFEQVLITAAVENDVPEELRGTTIRIHAGRVVEPGATT
ncbi:DNA replication/repair protein RecF [uncultured Schumannella sp.]|uniref:DNA replication/repair protein RecF n=1 Tax=uncultured Schumannella sp. TaxID=1195956 RepID=UPI0025D79E76|nr:DNA replication/repair protein RecF [uncultured Schumannella sp.]